MTTDTNPEHLPSNHLVMHDEDHGCIIERARRMDEVIQDFVIRHIEKHGNIKAASDMCRQFERKIRLHGKVEFVAAVSEAIDRNQIVAAAVYTLLKSPPKQGYDDELISSPRPTGNVSGPDYYNNNGDT